ncbi:hypothetical protein PoB_003615900 [Plakobranchus ocellatus]|uniref:HTH psq-type domain-containing protein n=1 Tax=Plakobranchus ocellatus TaxID=259542 RepID=A0AAV4ATI5_9GAST|nr:hypothetical protein PoB_003615900 [Plakobranchus ocellatus]
MGKTQTKKEIAEKYGIPANTLSTILKNREKLEMMVSTSSVNLGKKRMRPSKVEDVDVASTTPRNYLSSFYSQEESSETENETSQEDRELVSLFDRLKGVVPVDGKLGAFLYIDEDVTTAEETSIQQIAAVLREDKSESEEETAPTTAAEARSALLTLKKFVIEQGTDDMRSLFFSCCEKSQADCHH